MDKDYMDIDELLKYIRNNEYRGGEVFVNQLGEEIMWNGDELTGFKSIRPHDQWRFVEVVAV